MTDTVANDDCCQVSENLTRPGSLNDIVTGNFEQQSDAQEALAELIHVGFSKDRLTMFPIEPGPDPAVPSDGITADCAGNPSPRASQADAQIPASGSPEMALAWVSPRKPGTLLAVSAPSAEQQQRVIALLRAHGAIDIELTEGAIVDGFWTDYDSAKPPHLID